ncbi:hypothetical protein FH039_09025 [Thermococcus indicus]|uniref:Uncharacterized protein n=1 Tax=Thermococcus indicus TaxID=2586643 RepID=A0A4Y5SNP6_9EURY|nr:hypothetical protein [Thermococcus indicus]QDA31712.1 hypothetical protein FH039_09025 [Thermococcus indicus]
MKDAKTLKYSGYGYKCLGPLAEEIILAKLERASSPRDSVGPFFRENYRTSTLNLSYRLKLSPVWRSMS